MKKLYFIISLFVFISCVASERYDLRPYETSDMTTDLGIQVWLDGQEGIVGIDEIDTVFLDTVEEMDRGPVPLIDLVIVKTICLEYPDGLVYCGFQDPRLPFMLAGLYSPPRDIKIHLMNGTDVDGKDLDPEKRWPLEWSAFGHEVEHHVRYWYDEDDWNLNEMVYTKAKGILR